MAISYSKVYLTSDNQSWTKLAEAQVRELAITLAKDVLGVSEKTTEDWEPAALTIVKSRDAVLTILKQKERQRTRSTKPKRAARVAAKPVETVTA